MVVEQTYDSLIYLDPISSIIYYFDLTETNILSAKNSKLMTSTNKYIIFYYKKYFQSEEGFSLIETSIALVTLAVCLAYAMPLFLYAKINNSKSEVRTGALIVAQRAFDNIRAQSLSTLPITDGLTNPNLTGCTNVQPGLPDITGCANAATAANPVLLPATIGSPTAAEKLLTNAMGRQYQTKITYCQGLNGTPPDPTVCSTNYRRFKVEVFKNDGKTKVYDLEGTYTKFD
jgi:type II secretory pathway pseudopilin PulG